MKSTLYLHGLMSSSTQDTAPWERPTDWLVLPGVSETDEKFVGLLAIVNGPDENRIALSATGNFTVDWGDGTVENFGSDVTAQHIYDYSTVPLGTLTGRGYKQVVVIVTPQAGATFAGINLQLRHSTMPATIYNVPWLDLAVSGAALSRIRFTNSLATAGTTKLVSLAWCEQVKLIRTTATTMRCMFQQLHSLRSVVIPVTTAVTDMGNMFESCYALQTIPLFDTVNVRDMDSMFARCYSLYTIPLLNTVKVTAMNFMFQYCYNLQKVPLLDTAAATNMSSMFQGCYALREIALPNTTLVNSMFSMFASCHNLQKVSLPDTGNVISMNYMFQYCYNLQEVPTLNTIKANNMVQMFNSCYNLKTVPAMATGLVTDTSSMFNNCYNLQTVSFTDMTKLGSSSGMFYECNNLQSVEIPMAAVTSAGNMFYGCKSLTRAAVTGTKVAISYANCKLSAAALVDIFTGLADLTALTSQTITISGNWGAAALSTAQRDIALNKNWTITG